LLSDRRRNVGSIRQLPSTRFSASVRKYGIRIAAPKTFDSYAEASAWCEKVVNELWQAKYQVLQQNGLASSILNSQNGSDGRSVTLSEFAADWMNGNIHLRDRTKYDYQRIIDRWLKVNVNGRKFTDHYLTELDLLLVKKWVEEVSKEASTSTVQYAYRVLRAILNEAAAAGLIEKAPAPLKHMNSKAKERPMITLDDLVKLADAVPTKYRAAVLIAGTCGLRAGELFGLRRRDVDVSRATIRVSQAVVNVPGKGAIVGPPKTRTSNRLVSVPTSLIDLLQTHIINFTNPNPDAFVFEASPGIPITVEERRGWWDEARKTTGLENLHWHDLRHFAATLAAQHGASMAELQARLGHSTVNAAMRYQHATHERDLQIARNIDQALLKQHQKGLGLEETG
jgi:integrase